MEQKHDSVFISYRRSTSRHLARLVFNDLHTNEFDPFLDVTNLGSGEFGRVILKEISARAHFIFLVSHGSLQRCDNPADWLRREFEEAVRIKRNIVPVYDEGLSIDAIKSSLVGPLEGLPRYNGISLYHEYFEAGMEKLREWLSSPIIVVLEDRDDMQQAEIQERVDAAVESGLPTERELAAEKAYNAAWQTGDMAERIRWFGEAIGADPSFAAAYFDRGNAYRDKGDYINALKDYDLALEHNPADPDVFVARGRSREKLGRSSEALQDFGKAVDLYTAEISNTPQDLNLRLARAATRKRAGDLDGALDDYSYIIELPEDQLKPLWEGESGEEYKNFPAVNALWARGLLRFKKGDFGGTIHDCDHMIELAKNKPDFGEVSMSLAHYLRGTAHGVLGQRMRAVRDLRKGAALSDMEGEKLDLLFSAYLLAWPLMGKTLELGDPFKEQQKMFTNMADDL